MRAFLGLVAILAIDGMVLAQEFPTETKGRIFCKLCQKTLIVSDADGCRKVDPAVSEYMKDAICSPAWQQPVILSCPHDDGELDLEGFEKEG